MLTFCTINIYYNMNRLILSFSLFLMIFGATTSPTWLTSNSIKAGKIPIKPGLVTLISSSTSSDFDYNLTFSSSYSGTANVQVVPGTKRLIKESLIYKFPHQPADILALIFGLLVIIQQNVYFIFEFSTPRLLFH